MKIANSLTELIGNTPLIRLMRFETIVSSKAKIVAKLESFNPLSSAKDRVALYLIDDAERRGLLKPGGTIIEPTSGNTGIGLAYIAVSRGYRVILTMPDTMSTERRSLLTALGAELVLTEGALGMNGAIKKAEKLLSEIPGSFIPGQFENPANVKAHRETTAREILRDTDGKLDFFVAGVGTGGTITGVGEVLKENLPGIKIVAVEPKSSPVLSGGAPGPHKLQGIGAGFVPKILNEEIIDRIVTVADDEAVLTCRSLAKTEGLLCGISSGAALSAAAKLSAEDGMDGKTIVVLLPDTGERYLSAGLFF